MIPDAIIEFLKKPVVMHAASRDEQLQSYSVRAFGPASVVDRELITFYIPQRNSKKILDCYLENKRAALVACDVTSFETYQFKGEFASTWECGEEEYALLDTYVEQAKAVVIEIGFPEEFVNGWKAWNCKPSVAVSFKVEDIFHQTPGPGTGDAVTE